MSVVPPEPTRIVPGAREVSAGVGVGVDTVMLPALLVPPPGVGFTTVTFNFPAVATSVALRVLVICVALTTVAACAVVPTSTVEPATKLVPTMVIGVEFAVPAATLVGLIETIIGAGLFTGKDAAAEVPPPGLELTAVRFRPLAVERSVTVRIVLT